MNDDVIGDTENSERDGRYLALGVTALAIAVSVGITAMETAGLLDFEKFLQVSGVISPMFAAALGGVLYGKRS